jgi:hypothetical protein
MNLEAARKSGLEKRKKKSLAKLSASHQKVVHGLSMLTRERLTKATLVHSSVLVICTQKDEASVRTSGSFFGCS